MPIDNSVDGDIDGHSSDEDRNAVEVVFDPSNPYRRKSSLVSSEAVRPRLRKSTIVPSPNDKAHCVVHHFLEAQRLGGNPAGGDESHHHHHLGRKFHPLHSHHQPRNIRQIDEAVEESRDGTDDGDTGSKAIDASEERGLNRKVEPKGSSSTNNLSNNSSSSYLPRNGSHADVARLRDQSMVVEATTSDSEAGQIDEKEWAQGIVTGDLAVPPKRKKKEAVTGSQTAVDGGGDGNDEKVEVSAANSLDKDSTASTEVPEPVDILHSRLLTKKQLSEMAWGVRELSRRLGSLRLKFRVKTIFLLTKIYDEDLLPKARALTKWLLSHERDVRYTVYFERSLKDNKIFDMPGLLEELRREEAAAIKTTNDGNSPPPSFAANLESRLRFWDESMCRTRPHTFDFVITLGGDGTVLYASWLFQRIVPPVLSFSLGSLGFLTKFDFDDYQATLTRAFAQGVTVSLRLRFEATIMRSQTVEKAVLTDGDDSSSLVTTPRRKRDLVEELIGEEKDDEHTHRPDGTFEILNEVVVDRGPNATMSYMEIFGDDEHFTSVLADGICVSTPTGSTAYNLAAGGSLCHPENPVMLVTSICPHTLSFRPIILPDTIVLRVGVPYDARTSSWASFDGRERVELHPGDYVTISASRFPFASVQAPGRRSEDWVNSISGKLGWNTRQKQKAYKEWDK
ncbi:atp nad kinase [Ophiostoma piceae UAMH 11346]|uniref:Atp nad kinase n=1 Tax=Ophiostoma piceae (strain UAMH 11346) TaxID=1262450 RepID=S3BNX9_OPHP1|nr:atp nad kinase [Ophiostoma piceae UAMH 11346]